MTCKVLPFDRVRWLSKGRRETRAHAFERDHFVSLCGTVTMAAHPDGWHAASVGLTCVRCKAALHRGKRVRE